METHKTRNMKVIEGENEDAEAERKEAMKGEL